MVCKSALCWKIDLIIFIKIIDIFVELQFWDNSESFPNINIYAMFTALLDYEISPEIF